MVTGIKKSIQKSIFQPVSVYPLVTLRVLFGAVMLFSTVRFWMLGWIENHYINPQFHFHYFGFEWVEPLAPWAMYAIHAGIIIAALGIMLGAFYRFSAFVFFVLFTYTELIDLTYYLNHYYFMSLLALLMIFLPAHRQLSFDVKWGITKATRYVEKWNVLAPQLLVGIVYFYAGIAKINEAWLLEAMPLKIWLPAHSHTPLIGQFLGLEITAYLFSWAGMLYDVSVPFLLLSKKLRPYVYWVIVAFHSMTSYFFEIGVFPLAMTGVVLIFWSGKWHEKLWHKLSAIFHFSWSPSVVFHGQSRRSRNLLLSSLTVFFAFQLLFPFRYLLYPGNLFWNEEGYRFSWRVMLVEKAGTATFYVKDGENGREGEVVNSEFLNPHQEKQMAFQPDMILQFAHYLESYYREKGFEDPIVRCESWVTMNGERSELIVDPHRDLTEIEDSFKHKNWILPHDVENTAFAHH